MDSAVSGQVTLTQCSIYVKISIFLVVATGNTGTVCRWEYKGWINDRQGNEKLRSVVGDHYDMLFYGNGEAEFVDG